VSGAGIYRHYLPAVTPVPGPGGPGYWFAFCLTGLLLSSSPDGLRVPFLNGLEEVHLSPVRIQFLGTLHGRPCFAAEVPAQTTAPYGMSFHELRSVYGAIDEDLFLLAGRALQIVNWDQTHQFCGRCGHLNEPLPGERAKKCPACGFTSYPRLSPAVITAVIRDNQILLARYAAFRGHMHTILAGFVEPGETLEECLRREVFEEVGLRVGHVKYFGSQPWPFPNSLMIGFTAEYQSGEILADGKEIAEAGWYHAGNLPELPPRMSIAREIIDWFVKRGPGGDAPASRSRAG
jgi:NAD+ diphosphatase